MFAGEPLAGRAAPPPRTDGWNRNSVALGDNERSTSGARLHAHVIIPYAERAEWFAGWLGFALRTGFLEAGRILCCGPLHPGGGGGPGLSPGECNIWPKVPGHSERPFVVKFFPHDHTGTTAFQKVSGCPKAFPAGPPQHWGFPLGWVIFKLQVVAQERVVQLPGLLHIFGKFLTLGAILGVSQIGDMFQRVKKHPNLHHSPRCHNWEIVKINKSRSSVTQTFQIPGPSI